MYDHCKEIVSIKSYFFANGKASTILFTEYIHSRKPLLYGYCKGALVHTTALIQVWVDDFKSELYPAEGKKDKLIRLPVEKSKCQTLPTSLAGNC